MPYKKKQFHTFSEKNRTVYDNRVETRRNPVRKWYTTVQVDETSYLLQYDSKFRSEALEEFDRQARLMNGKRGFIGSF